MSILNAAKPMAKNVVRFGLRRLPAIHRRKVKEHFELKFWDRIGENISQKAGRERERALLDERSHYEYFFTACFGLSVDDYAGQRILDIGCGPMGSLEWANAASLRVGLDPLADHYKKCGLGTEAHRMSYVTAPSEDIPFDDGFFDFVTSFNSLDHVEDVAATIGEIKRVAAADARILLMTEINHPSTLTEPHQLSREVVKMFEPEFVAEVCEVYGVRADHNLWAGKVENIPYREGELGVLFAKFARTGRRSRSRG